MSDNLRADTAARLNYVQIATVPKDPNIVNSIIEFKLMLYKTLVEAGYTGEVNGLTERLVELLENERNLSGKINCYDTFDLFPEKGIIETLYIDNSTSTPYLWDGEKYIKVIPADITNHINNKDIHFEKDGTGSLNDIINGITDSISEIEDTVEENKEDLLKVIEETNEELEEQINEALDDLRVDMEKCQKECKNNFDELDTKIDAVSNKLSVTNNKVIATYNALIEHVQNNDIHLTPQEKQALANILGLKYDPNGELLKFRYV